MLQEVPTFPELVKKAKSVIKNAYEDAHDIRLEEFEPNSTEIIVSFLLPDKRPIPATTAQSQFLNALRKVSPPLERVYKRIIFNDEFEVESVKVF